MRSFLTSVHHRPSPVVSPTGPLIKSKLGVNLNYLNDFDDTEMMFVNIVKNARCFGPLTGYGTFGGNVSLDVNGWPTVDFGMIVFSQTTDPLSRTVAVTNPGIVGTYKLSFTGQATLASGDCTISNKVYTSGTNTTTADVTFAGTTTQTISVEFSGTTGGCQNIILNRPGYAIGTTQVFTTAFLNALAPFSAFRCMDTLAINGNVETAWASRRSVNNPIQSSDDSLTNHGKGVAYEYLIQLANTTGMDLWINIPYHVDVYDATGSNYVTQLATLIKANLNAGIHVYVEYSNELWNGKFPQYTDITADANAAQAVSGDPQHLSSPAAGAVNNEGYYANRLQANRTRIIAGLFKTVYGTTLFASTVRIVLMSQGTQPYYAEDMMYYLASNWTGASGAPSTYLYAIGGAAYISVQLTVSDVDSTPVTFADLNALFASLNSNTVNYGYQQIIPYFAETPAYTTGDVQVYDVVGYKPIANYYGIKTVLYEGGTDLGTNNNVLAENSLADSRTATFITNLINQWFSHHGDMFFYYELATGVGQLWGLYEDVTVSTVKSNALTAISATALPP
jgi:hypothetical protein